MADRTQLPSPVMFALDLLAEFERDGSLDFRICTLEALVAAREANPHFRIAVPMPLLTPPAELQISLVVFSREPASAIQRDVMRQTILAAPTLLNRFREQLIPCDRGGARLGVTRGFTNGNQVFQTAGRRV